MLLVQATWLTYRKDNAPRGRHVKSQSSQAQERVNPKEEVQCKKLNLFFYV